MTTGNDTERPVAFNRAHLWRLNRGIKRLFMDIAGANSDPEEQVRDAQQKIAEVRNYLLALNERYPMAQYPKKKFRKIRELFADLERSCEKAEDRMRRFTSIRLRNGTSPR
jgi:hypothetical protein